MNATSALRGAGPLVILPLVVALAILAAALGCQASDSMPPLLGTQQPDSALLDVSTETVDPGACPGRGTVTVAFDGGSGREACWSAFATVSSTEPNVALTGKILKMPGLGMGILLRSISQGTTVCSIVPGAKVALDGPCVFVAANYLSGDGTYEWQAFAGKAVDAGVPASASDAGPRGTILIGSYGLSLGDPVSLTFSPDSTLVVDEPGYPIASISGSVSVAIENGQ